MNNIDTIQQLISRGAIFFSNHSGGKDSQAMYLYLREIVPADQLVVIHSHLPDVEWEGTKEHIQQTVTSPIHIVQANKTFFQMVDHRQQFPSPKNRQCTSDLKRGPIEKEIRRVMKDKNKSIVVNCMGLRADESSGRKNKIPFQLNDRNSKAGREWYDWLPIHHLTTKEVFSNIREAGQKPHWVYAAGMTRKSCCFCIMASKEDLKTAAKLKPELLQQYVDREKKYDRTMLMPSKKDGRMFLSEIVS